MPTPKPIAQGNLDETPFLHLLAFLLDNELSGTLELEEATGRASQVYFDGGVPAKVRASMAPLDRILAEMGAVDGEQLKVSRAESARRGRLHGEVLLERGLLTPETLVRALRWQIVRKVGHLSRLPASTRFRFYGQNLMTRYGSDELTHVEPLSLILWGARMRGVDDIVTQTLARFGAARLRLHTEAPLERFELTAEERTICRHIVSRRPRLRTLLAVGIAPEDTVKPLLYTLAITRALGVTGAYRPVGVAKEFDLALDAKGTPAPGSLGVAIERTAHEQSGVYSTPAPGNLGATDLVDPTAWSREWLTPPPGMLKVAVEQVRAALSANGRSRDGAANGRSRDGAANGRSRDGADAREQAAESDRAEPEASSHSYIRELRPNDRAPAPASLPPPAILPYGADLAAADEADEPAAPPLPVELNEQAAKEAVARLASAQRDFEAAEKLYRRGALEQAEALLRGAVGAAQFEPAWLTLLARVSAERRGAPALRDEKVASDWYLREIALLERALGANPDFVPALFLRGQLHGRVGEGTAAMRDFRRIRELCPSHLDAAREIRVIEMRARREREKPKKGLLGQLIAR